MNLKELFDNNADCYTDVQKMNSKGAYDWTEEQAMTRDKFEEVVKKLILSSVSQQRELLIGLLKKLENGGGSAFIEKEQIVDDYLKAN